MLTIKQHQSGKQKINNNLKQLETKSVCCTRSGKQCLFFFFKNVICPMERIAGIHAVYTVSTRRVTDSTEVVCLAVQKGRDVTEIYASHMPTNTLIIVAAIYILMTLSLIKKILKYSLQSFFQKLRTMPYLHRITCL